AWTSPQQTARRISDLIAYLDDPNDLIRDDTPVIGRLDDALLVDIAMDTLREEVDDYAEFRRYRFSESLRRGVAIETLELDRPRWQAEREDELRLERQLRHVRGAEYSASAAERVFRVC
ncbi:MAG: YkvA family protein, partial [Dokdonella sp.]